MTIVGPDSRKKGLAQQEINIKYFKINIKILKLTDFRHPERSEEPALSKTKE